MAAQDGAKKNIAALPHRATERTSTRVASTMHTILICVDVPIVIQHILSSFKSNDLKTFPLTLWQGLMSYNMYLYEYTSQSY